MIPVTRAPHPASLRAGSEPPDTGLLWDPTTRLVYYQPSSTSTAAPPAAGPPPPSVPATPTKHNASATRPSTAPASAVGDEDSYLSDFDFQPQQQAKTPAKARQDTSILSKSAAWAVDASPAAKARPQLPVLVGKLQGPGRTAGAVAALTVEDVLTVERCRNALRCLRRGNAAAAMLMRAAREASRQGAAGRLLADLSPELGYGPWERAVSLAVPLCAVLGVARVQELQDLTPQDLRQVSERASGCATCGQRLKSESIT